MIYNKNKIKIGILTRPIDQKTSGSGSYLNQLLIHFLNKNENYDVHLIHYKECNAPIYKNTKQIIIPRNPIFASILLSKFKFDIIHYTPLTLLSPLYMLSSKKIATVFGGFGFVNPEVSPFLENVHEQYIVPKLARLMDHILTISIESLQYIKNRYKLSEDKITLAYPGISDAFTICKDKNKESFVRAKFKIDGPYLFHISKYSLRKNPELLINSFELVKQKHKNIKLVIAGQGWDNEHTKQLIKNKNIIDSIIFTSYIPEDELAVLLNYAEAFLFPSFYEGFGMPNIEAMACGCPVVTTNTFAIPEVVGDAALLCQDPKSNTEFADLVLMILENDSVKENLVNKGFERIKLFNWHNSADILTTTYEKLLNK